MKLNFLGWAVPLFTGLMLLEYFIAKKKKLPYFNLHSSIANVSIGIAERLADVFVSVLFYFIYDHIQKKYGLFHIQPGVLLWLLLFLLTDLLWYWYHRLAHEINVFWLVHVVHHQSEDYNFTVSARITVMQALVRTGFWAVLPFIGFPASMITSFLIIHGLYPFFIHTRLIGKLGILEYILVTPSHHRVHHACNPKYLDKNYGDVLIIWDKLFGTFQKEEDETTEPIVFGLTKPINTYSFLWQHFHFFIELWLAVKSKKTFREKARLVFGKPEYIDPRFRQKAESIFHMRQPGTIEKPLNRYVVWQMVIQLITLTLFILFEQYISLPVKIIFVISTILTLINCGAIMEQKRWVFLIEYSRLLTMFLLPFYSLDHWQLKLLVVMLLLFPLLMWYRYIRVKYYRYVYRG